MIAALAVLLALALPAAAAPAPDPAPEAAICEAVAIRAARSEGVPQGLMRAISLAETGRARGGRLRPWPWTVNMEGEGRWFDAPAPLLDWVRARQAAGARSFDLGCFQVNHLWHGEAFDSLEQMLDPQANALYAARFLRELHDETGSWEVAAGLYHSRTPELAARYRGRVLEILARLEDAPPPDLALAMAEPQAAENLRARASGAAQALIREVGLPLLRAGRPLFGPVPAGPAADGGAGRGSLAGPLLASAGSTAPGPEGAGPGLLRTARSSGGMAPRPATEDAR